MPLKITIGNIEEMQSDAVVNFYIGKIGNDSYISKKIHAFGGNKLLEECIKVKRCLVGNSVLTRAFGVSSEYIIHTVAPTSSENFEHNLAKCYRSSFVLCDTKGITSITYPLIISDDFPISIDKTIKIAINRIAANLKHINENIFVCLLVPNMEILNMTLAIAKDILPEKYYTTEEIPLKKQSVSLKDKNNIQELLIENYELLRGELTEEQLGTESFKRWTTTVRDLYAEIINLKDKAWNTPTELKEISKESGFWEAIKCVFCEQIGLVNGYHLRYTGDIVCLLMTYAISKNWQSVVTEERFRRKLEYYLARCIIEQKAKSLRILKDEKKDRNSISSLRKIKKAIPAKVVEKQKSEELIKFDKNSVLYIYKGNIRCHRYKHNTVQATAILHNRTDNEIKLNVEYCTECKKFILEYTVFEEYRARYGALIGNFRMAVNGGFDGGNFVAQESPLMLSGYNVGQKDGYTSSERQYILARLIYDGIMSKGEIIRYLSYFIRKNGARSGNDFALSKWRDDLEFVQNYSIETQPRTVISSVCKY